MAALDEPDVSRRGLRAQPVSWALLGVAAFSFLWWLVSHNLPQLMLTVALVFAIVLDAVTARLALADLRLHVQAPLDGIAGQDLTYLVRATGLRRPVRVSRPGVWPFWHTEPVVIDRELPGALLLTAPPRGIIRFLVFDVTADGALGLYSCVRRLRVWLPTPTYVGPPPLEHEVEWPRQRALRFGEHEVAKVGHDLFRGTRPYVRGDAQRSVHWPATAHHGQLMVRETDGLGMVALRVVVHLPEPGPAAEHAAGRAAFIAREGTRRGWLVHLVSIESHAHPPPPPPLTHPTGPIPPAPLAPPAYQQADRRITAPADISRQLAATGYGMPSLARWPGITCVVSPWGDEWR